jgi:hypothetical protein
MPDRLQGSPPARLRASVPDRSRFNVPIRRRLPSFGRPRPGLPPVFLDHRGRRRRLVIGLGTIGAAVLCLAIVGLVAGFAGPGTGHLPGLPGLTPRHSAAVQVSPSPASGSAQTTPGGVVQTTGPTPATTTPVVVIATSTTHRRIPTQTPSHTKRT